MYLLLAVYKSHSVGFLLVPGNLYFTENN